MLTQEQFKPYMPDWVYPLWRGLTVVLSMTMLLVLYANWSESLLTQRRFVLVVFTYAFVWFLMTMLWNGSPTLAERRETYKINNRIGYQVVWMLNANRELVHRVERRDHQYAQLNTSEWVVYEPLGGPNRGMSIATRDRSSSTGFALKLHGFSITRVSQFHVRVRRAGHPFDEEVQLAMLLDVLNTTGGHLGFDACSELIIELRKATETIRIQTNDIDVMRSIIDEKEKIIRELGHEQAKLLTQLAVVIQGRNESERIRQETFDALGYIVNLTNKRSTRVSDIHSFAAEELKKLIERKAKKEALVA